MCSEGGEKGRVDGFRKVDVRERRKKRDGERERKRKKEPKKE